MVGAALNLILSFRVSYNRAARYSLIRFLTGRPIARLSSTM
jgi:hypothetical protein